MLEMPARQFFAMLQEVRILQAEERVDDCDIAIIPSQAQKFHEDLKGYFARKAAYFDEVPQLPAQPGLVTAGPPIAVDGEDAKHALIGLFGDA